MDTEKMYFLDEKIDISSFIELSQNELEIIKHFVEITRHLQEIHQLFLILKFDLSCLQERYVLMASGEIFKGDSKAEEDNDYIAVNAYTTNIISAGRTLLESIECYVKENGNDDTDDSKKFIDYSKKTYDKSFAYRFLIKLRNFSQHGHLAVSKTGNNYYFDLKQIVDKPHYKHSNTLKREMEHIIDEIIENYKNTPTLSFTRTVAEFIMELCSIYKEFWASVEQEFKNYYFQYNSIIELRPENIIRSGNDSTTVNFFIYEIEDCAAQAVCLGGDAMIMFNELKNEAELIYNEYLEAYRQLTDGTFWIRLVDKKYIEIGMI